MVILGINNMHDASAAIAVDGRIVAAAEEERFTRVKHAKGFPENAIRFCLAWAGVGIGDVDWVCASWKPWVIRVRAREAFRSIAHSPSLFRAKSSRGLGQLRNEWAELFDLPGLIRRRIGNGRFRVTYVDHHLSHAASAFFCSSFDKAAILTVDGAGEAETTVLWLGEGRNIGKLDSVSLPHSLGQFYSAVTAFLGFKVQSDEYKVMGLASYGEPRHRDILRERVLRLSPDGSFTLDPYFIDYHLARKGVFRHTTTGVFGAPRRQGEEVTQRHADIAASAQAVVEESIFHLARQLQKRTGVDTLGMAGGVAFNCVANGKLYDETPFRKIFIHPAAGDAGGAIGAALWQNTRISGVRPDPPASATYLGPSFTSRECENALREAGLAYERIPEEILLKKVARQLTRGEIACWFQGRMEWGPRALGNRSFLADPRREEMKDLLNTKIKRREPFRPFAPSVTEERSPEFFGNPEPSPYMQFTFPVRPDKKALIPAVTHVDGSARPQTVSEAQNPRYWRLLREFEASTGIPVLLNTSFNVQEPIVCSPQDAIRCFLGTDADVLVLEDLLVTRVHPGG